MFTLLILDIRRIADTYDRKSHTENSSALLEGFRSVNILFVFIGIINTTLYCREIGGHNTDIFCGE
jgi:hypothetical protein